MDISPIAIHIHDLVVAKDKMNTTAYTPCFFFKEL